MNHVYRSHYDKVPGTWVDVPGIAETHGNSSVSTPSTVMTGSKIFCTALAPALFLASGQAMDVKGNEIAGKQICFYDATTQSVVCGDATTEITNTFIAGNPAKSIAMGIGAKSNGEQNVSIGDGAKALTRQTIAIGRNAEVSGTTLLPNSVYTSGVSGVAIGTDSKVENRNYGIAIGDNAFVGTYDKTKAIAGKSHYNPNRQDKSDEAGRTGVAIGWKTQSTGDDSIALGNDSIATGRSSIALGKAAYAEDTDATAIGNNARAGQPVGQDTSKAFSNHNSTAIGSYAQAVNGWNTAVGTRSHAAQNQGAAFGTLTYSKAQRATAIGSYSYAGSAASTALGYESIVTDKAKSGIALGAGAVVSGANSGVLTSSANLNPTHADFQTDKTRSFVGGNDSFAIGNKNVIGSNASDTFILGNEVKLGATGAKLSSTNPNGKGTDISSRVEDAQYDGLTNTTGMVALGSKTKVSVSHGVALGYESNASIDKDITGADPLGAAGPKDNAIWKSTRAAVSVGDIGNNITRQITSVAAGTEDTDAVNVAQLKAAGFKFTVNGGAETPVKNGDTLNFVGQNGVTITQQGNTLTFTGRAQGPGPGPAPGAGGFKLHIAADGGIANPPAMPENIPTDNSRTLLFKAGKNIELMQNGSEITIAAPNAGGSGGGTINNITRIVNNTTVSAGNNINVTRSGDDYKVALANDIAIDSLTTGPVVINKEGLSVNGNTYVDANGLNANGQSIRNVAAGRVAPDSTDAVNGAQLHALGQRVSDVDKRARAGIASAMASAGLPQAYRPGANMLAASAGYYDGQSAVAIGASTISDNGRWIVKGTLNVNSKDAGVTVGVGYQW